MDFTLKEVSEKIGFNNYQTLTSIEAGREGKSNIARVFNVSIETLLWRFVNLGLLKKQNIQIDLIYIYYSFLCVVLFTVCERSFKIPMI